MPPSNSQLDEHILARDLIACSRDKIDPNRIQGFPLRYSQDLLLLRYVYDFHLDGLLLIRRSDITEIRHSATDQFQRKLLLAENRLKRGIFQSDHSVDSFSSFLRDLKQKQIVVIENELPPEERFYIGRLSTVTSSNAEMQEFSGAGNWEQVATNISIQQITSCQIETNYINFYARYFDRASK